MAMNKLTIIVLFASIGFVLPACAGTLPSAGFKFSPGTPSVNQSVQFTDTSSGTPKGWRWSFGDGATSTLQNPSHSYAVPGAFTVTLTAKNASGSSTASQNLSVTSVAQSSPFRGNIMLGAPTNNSIIAKVFSPDQSGTLYIEYGTTPGVYSAKTNSVALTAGTPLPLLLDGLMSNTRYYYRLNIQVNPVESFHATPEYSFHTARSPGEIFTFTIQADSHLDGNADLSQYHTTLGNILADNPDFHIDLGDTFMCEKNCEPLTSALQTPISQAMVDARYVYERQNFGLITHSAPLFLVNGNHDGEWGWLANNTEQNLAIWATRARQKYFMNPVPDGYYSGDPLEESFVGKRATWYAWHWGDALFLVLDPYWYTTIKSNNPWSITLGQRQYQWLEKTLSTSNATFKFVFIHNLVGGLDGQMRGGVEAAPFFEWGGSNVDGTPGFALQRPGWNLPIHQLLTRYGVTAVFHGHDHLYAKQDLDGIVYQEVPQPSAKNFMSGPTLAAAYHYTSGNLLSSSGHLRVTVSPQRVTAQYVRSWLPKNETNVRKNAQVEDTWFIEAPR